MSAGAAAGSALALRLETTTLGTYVDLGGMKTKTFSVNNEPIETTNSDSTGRWREYLTAGLALKTISFSGDGVFKDGAPTDRLMVIAMSASAEVRCQLFVPTLGTFEGLFKITNVEYSGDQSDAVAYSMAAESQGAITFTNIV